MHSRTFAHTRKMLPCLILIIAFSSIINAKSLPLPTMFKNIYFILHSVCLLCLHTLLSPFSGTSHQNVLHWRPRSSLWTGLDRIFPNLIKLILKHRVLSKIWWWNLQLCTACQSCQVVMAGKMNVVVVWLTWHMFHASALTSLDCLFTCSVDHSPAFSEEISDYPFITKILEFFFHYSIILVAA